MSILVERANTTNTTNMSMHPPNEEDKRGDIYSTNAHESEVGSQMNEDEDLRKRKQNPMIRLLLKFTKKQVEVKKKELTLDMLQPSRYKPNALSQMAEDTKFSKREVRSLYRAFKQECPSGIVDEESFKEVYEKIFPLGDPSQYAHLVFSAIDSDKTGGITFGDFMEFLSVICKGSTQDKLLWAFRFYDVDRDGVISKEEMLKVSESIHELMGNSGNTQAEKEARISEIFDTMDLNHDGKITIEEFLNYCANHREISDSMTVLTVEKVI